MATRTERIVLELESNITSQAAKDAAAIALLKRELGGLDKSSTNASGGLQGAERDVSKLGNTAGGSSRELDRFSGRLGLIVSGLGAIGPATVPLGAVAIPAVTTLASGLGFLAVGAGTTVLAFHGLGDALTKFNKAAANPTATSIAAAQAAMDKIAPSAQAFVLELHKLGPELERLQQAAGSGLFPGLTAGLKEAQDALPAVERIFRVVADEVGSLARDAGKSLGSNEWAQFLKFIGEEAPHALAAMGHALGSVTHGLAGLWTATQPLNGGGLDWIAKAADGFDRWANGLDKTQGFQDFIAYVDENGPHVEQLLADTASLFADIVRAAAPLGGPTLQALDLIVKVLDAIANSPLATPLLLIGQLFAVLNLTNKAIAGIGINAKVGFGGVEAGARQSSSALQGVQAEARAAGAALRTLGANFSKNAAVGTPLLSGVDRGGLKSLGKGAALAGGVGLVASGAADQIGLTNTATLTLAGTIAGPLGAAVGGAVGLLLDMKSAAKDAGAGQAALDKVIANSASTWNDYSAAIASAKSASTPFGGPDSFVAPTGEDALKTVLSNPTFSLSNATADLFGKSLVQQANEGKAAAEQLDEAFSSSFTDLATQWHSSFLAPQGGFTPSLLNQSQLGAVIERAQPAMDALHISLADIKAAYDANDGSLRPLINSIAKWTNRAGSAAGRGKAVSAAFAAMADQSLTADQRVQGLTDALDGLIDPMLNLGQARDAFRQGLNDLDKSLAKHSRTLVGNSDAAITNRDAIRSQVSNLKTWIETQAKAGVAPEKMIATLKEGRQAIIDQGREAGLNAGRIRHMLDVMGLTPKQIKTSIQVLGTGAAQRAIDKLTRDRVIRITPHVDPLGVSDTTGTGGHVLTGSADGGTVNGPRAPYGDKVATMLAPGEEVISNRHGQADQHRALLKAINNRRYADGGTVAQTRVSVNVAGAPSVTAPGIDYGRLAEAVAAVRPSPPLYGDVHVTDGYGGFKRQMEQDRAQASLSGVRRG